MFIGEYTHSIDKKRRIAIPSKFRKELAKQGVITRGLDNCLVLYPQKEWKELAQKLGSLPTSKAEARGFARIMLAGAMEVKLDNLGRILIPKYLKDYADLKKEAVIAGLFNRIEIWNKKRWQKYKKKTEMAVEDIAKKLDQLGV